MFTKTGKDQQTFATALQATGYRTAMMGKYLNGYDNQTTYVPALVWGGSGSSPACS